MTGPIKVTGPVKPILRNSCAVAATAEEARFRIDRPIGGRKVLIVALDGDAAEIVDRLAERPWGDARFFHAPDVDAITAELDDADVVIAVGTAEADGDAASELARAGAARGIMLAGLILGEQHEVSGAVSALRPYARNLMTTEDEDDVAAVLTALRA
jgi:hypothetical protein